MHHNFPKIFDEMHENGLHDVPSDFVVPLCQQIDAMILEFAKKHLANSSDQLALDIGAGTGGGSFLLFDANPELKIIGMDISQVAVDLLKKKATIAGFHPGRFDVFAADALEDSAWIQAKNHASNIFNNSNFGLVFSSFTIHHFTPTQKLNVLQKIYDFLHPGGVFILCDRFNCSGESPWMTEAIRDFEIQWVHEKFEREINSTQQSTEKLKLKELQKRWITHYLKDDQPSSVSEHFAMLRKVGFSQVANPLRYYQIGVLWAKK
jgi:ubiquinone/menaquinone biosynthesis C-methylase UbiE